DCIRCDNQARSRTPPPGRQDVPPAAKKGGRDRTARPIGCVPPGMKRRMPVITLLTGAAVGVVFLAASMLAGRHAPARAAGAITPSPASSLGAPPSPASPAPAAVAVANVPSRADYAGEVNGGGASVAISVHGSQAIAYVCNGSVIEAWLKGTAIAGR